MRLIPSLLCVLMTICAPALAQETHPPVEVFGGYSFFHPIDGSSLHGWNASVAISVWRSISVVSDFAGHYGSQSLQAQTSSDGDFPRTISFKAGSNSSVHTLLVGPKFSYRANDKWTPFMHFLFGAVRLGADATITANQLSIESRFADLGFAAGMGGGLDVQVSDSVALRVIQAEYMTNSLNSMNQGQVRLSVGFVVR